MTKARAVWLGLIALGALLAVAATAGVARATVPSGTTALGVGGGWCYAGSGGTAGGNAVNGGDCGIALTPRFGQAGEAVASTPTEVGVVGSISQADGNCQGSFNAPTAPGGALCVYLDGSPGSFNSGDTQNVYTDGGGNAAADVSLLPFGASGQLSGAVLHWNAASAGASELVVDWAYTTP